MMNLLLAAALAVAPQAKDAPAQPQAVKHRVTGLFDRERENDLREAVKKLPAEVTVVRIDLDGGEVVFSYDPARLFAGTKPKDYIERFNNLLRQASGHTFGISAPFATPRERLTRVEFKVSAPDCKGCNLALHEYLIRTDGVAQATCSLKDGILTALIDPEKTNRAALEDLLKKRHVNVAK